MRNLLSILLVSLLLFSLTACGSEKSVSQGSGEESTEIPARESTEKDEVDFSQEEDALDAGQTPEPENRGKNDSG